MKILFQSRKTLFSGPGGDTIQILKTKEYLEKLGVEVDISTKLEPDVSNYDLVHIFNLMRPQEVYLQAKNAKKHGKKIALSTIYGLYTEYEKTARGGIIQNFSNILTPYQIEYLKILARGILDKEIHKGTLNVFFRGYYNTLTEILGIVDILLPNSQSEMNRIRCNFNCTSKLYTIIPNAVDSTLFDYNKVEVDDNVLKFKDCILCVSRIEGRKCQLNLVRAMKGLPYTLVLIGKPAPNHIKYFEQVKREAGGNVVFLDHIPHSELPQYYKVAKVHALVSWMETPGLSSLEAGIMKCNLVVTKKGDTVEYFRNMAFYCEPTSVESIRNAILKACSSPFNEKLCTHIMDNYTWKQTAEMTLKAYELVLKS